MRNAIIPSIRATIVLALYTGIIFPFLITMCAQTFFPSQANGSLVASDNGSKIIGSSLLGQAFTKPQYFHPRPSAAGSGYAGEASSGTNLGPTSKKLLVGDDSFQGIKQLAESYRTENSLPITFQVPVDAVTRSASGLDPDISTFNASIQANRVAKTRAIPLPTIIGLLKQYTEKRQLGFLGEPRVNVLKLNIALDHLKS